MILNLFTSFFKIGAFTIGGGYAMVPVIQAEVVDKRGWIAKDEFIDILAVAQSTPGALAINMASFIGYRKRGVLGATAATLGSVLPSFISILIIAIFFTRFMDKQIVKNAFMGIRPAVAALIAFSVFKIAKTSKIKFLWYSISVAAFIAVGFLRIDPIMVIFLSGLLGVIIYIFQRRGDLNDN